MVDPEAIANRFVDWFRARRITGIGSSTLKALVELEAGGHWAMVGATGERSAGNGAAMRAAPLAFCLNPIDDIQRRTIRDICRITHRNDEAYVGALALVYSIRHDRLDRSLILHLIEKLPDSRVRDRLLEIEAESLGLKELGERHLPTGYVVDSVPIAIVAATEAEDLLVSIQQIVELGGDCDTTASMFGNIYGAIKGESALPMELVRQIDEFDLINQTVSDFASVAADIASS